MDERIELVNEQDDVVGVADRDEATRRGWLHRIATTVCRDERGRILVHRRPDDTPLFPGYYDVLVGGGVDIGESYEEAARRELAEELGVGAPVEFVVKFLCRGMLGPYWMGVHEAVITGPLRPDPAEVPWYGWMGEAELRLAMCRWPFVPDGQEAFARYLAMRATSMAS